MLQFTQLVLRCSWTEMKFTTSVTWDTTILLSMLVQLTKTSDYLTDVIVIQTRTLLGCHTLVL